MFRVTLELRDSGVDVVEVNLLPVSNYRHPEYGVIVKPTEELSRAEDIPETWKSYYKERLEELTADSMETQGQLADEIINLFIDVRNYLFRNSPDIALISRFENLID